MQQKTATYTLLLILLLTSCNNPFRKTEWDVTLKNTDKKPYGTYLAYQSLKHYFPNAEISSLSQWFNYNNIAKEVKTNYNGTTVLVLVGLSFNLTENEWEQLLQFVNDGNELVLFSSNTDRKILKRLRCYKRGWGQEEYPLSSYNKGDKNREALQLTNTEGKFGYEGHSIQSYFLLDSTENAKLGDSEPGDDVEDKADTAAALENFNIDPTPDTLGLVKDKADILRYSVGEGHITLHAAPLTLSNYFLLQPNNIRYLDGLWSTLPADVNHIYWQEFFNRSMPVSGANVIWRYPATRFAAILAIIALLIYVLFESKRRQRIIPIIPPLENGSVSFIETVGRLYYNKKDHANLADKMINHFLEWVRNTYFINTNNINDAFIMQLTSRSGLHEETVRSLATMIHDIRLKNVAMDEAYLYELYNTIQLFYKNNTNRWTILN